MKLHGCLAAFAVAGVLLANKSEPAVRYFTCPVSRLEITEGTLLPPRYGNNVVYGEVIDIVPERPREPGSFSIHVDGGASAELVIQSRSGGVSWDHVFLVIKTEKSGPVTGSFRYWKDKQPQTVRWRLPDNANTVRAKDWYQFGVATRLDRTYRPLLRDANIPGQAWFRHRLQEIISLKSSELAGLWRTTQDSNYPTSSRKPEPLEPDFSWVSPITVNDWGTAPRWNNSRELTELLSGSRAISENLQLRRELNVRMDDQVASVKTADLKGIEVKEYDWGPQVRGLRPQLDPLAKWIPADQHTVFFPDVAAALSVFEEINRTGLAVWNLAAIRGIDERIADRYTQQLALPTNQLAKLLPASLVNNVAVTGSDLYFDTGTDVAVLFSSPKPGLVRQMLLATWPSVKTANPDAVEKDQIIDGISCKTLITPDRRICSYVAEANDLLMVTNSPIHVRKLVVLPMGKTATLDKSPEYIFFRDRYRRGEADESAFVILTDAAIRRWCSPMWRIGHQRRIQTGAYLADAQATHLQSMMAAKDVRTVGDTRLGPIEISPYGVASRVHGTRLFQTPIAEAAIEWVTTAEADAYKRWRDSYQQNWSQFFDPIAARLSLKPDRIGFDMTVMPLIAQTDYKEFVALTTGAQLPSTAGDPHPEALVHFVMGLNRLGDEFKKQMRNWAFNNNVPIESWIGDWVSVYCDADPILDEFAKSTKNDWEFWRDNNYRFPVGLAIAVNDVKKLHRFIDGIMPLVAGPDGPPKAIKHRDVEYRKNAVGFVTIYSLVLPDQWVLAVNENVIHHAIDRQIARKEGKPIAGTAWLGDSVGFKAQPKALQFFRDWWGRSGLASMQQAAWANLPILNEWHSLDTKTDPVEFHNRWWGERLVDPAGGKFVWNDTDQTMESSVLGHPGRPKGTRLMLPTALTQMRGVNLGITFEKEGLRGRFEVERES